MKRIVILALLALVAGDSQAKDLTPAELDKVYATAKPPEAWLRSFLAEQAKTYLVDPYSVRDAGISSVRIYDAKTGYASLCVRANAKNRMGGYTGMSTVAVFFYDNKLVNSVEDDPSCNDRRLKWHPFPELEAL